MKQKIIKSILLTAVVTVLFSVLFTGCTSNNITTNAANVKLEGFSHQETFEVPASYISTLSFTFQNKGNTIAENVNLNVDIKDNFGNEIFSKEVTLNSALAPDEVTVQTIDVIYKIEESQLNLDISINWDGGNNNYNRSYVTEFKEYADIILESMTHHENYNLSNGYTASVDLLLKNRGNMIAYDVKINVLVHDNIGNEEYNREENVVPLLMPWEVKSYAITVPYDFDDARLNFSITITWDGGVNQYIRSFVPEFKEFADVILESMTHYERYKVFTGYVSTINFIFQNKGSATADNIKISIIVNDNYGDEKYNSEATGISLLIPGEINSYEITVPYDFVDKLLDISIKITWDGGSNNYTQSFEPKILF